MTGQREQQAIFRNIYACYFLSGALGLVYQILWLRKLLLVFGSTVHAVSTILAVFFMGLALGSWLFGKWIDKHEQAGLRWYGYLELGVGLYALLTPILFDSIRHLYIPLYRASSFSTGVLVAASFVCASLILLIPTTLLGGTFPVLSRFLIRTRAERGTKIARLYGINTAGAMVGTLLVYYVGLPFLGLTRTLVCAATLNVGIGILCLLFDSHLRSLDSQAVSPADSTPEQRVPEVVLASDSTPRWLFASFALSGFSAMVYEVAWTRALGLVLGSSIYAFCVMLATFLGGMSIGSFWFQHELRYRPAAISGFIRMQLLLAGCGLLTIPIFSQLPEWFVTLWPLTGRTFTGLSWLQILLSGSAMLLPTILMGALFPLASDLVTTRFAQLGVRLGTLYAINTLGGILGSMAAGFLLIPRLGLPGAIIAAALINLIAGLLIAVRFGTRRHWVVRVGLALASVIGVAIFARGVVFPFWKKQVFSAGAYLEPHIYTKASVDQLSSTAKLLYYRDSLNATVSVHQKDNVIFLKVGGKTDASNGIDMATQVLSAHLPLLFHPDPKSALVIGLGSGVTLGHATRYPLVQLDCAELDPAVIEAARFFKEYNYHVHEDPRTTIYPVDGRNFLLAASQPYDVIISEPSNPWMAGVGYLFTKEFYELAKSRLAANGIMCQWLQMYHIFPDDVKLMLKTFHQAFPHVSVWSPIPGDLLFIGSMEPQRVDYADLRRRIGRPEVQKALKGIHADDPDVLMQSFLLGNDEVEELTANVSWLHEDDLPWLEFDTPKALYSDNTFMQNYQGIQRFKGTAGEIIFGYAASDRAASFYQKLSQFHEVREEFDKAIDFMHQAIALEPDSVEHRLRLAWLAQRVNKFALAEKTLNDAISLSPQNGSLYRALGQLHCQQSDWRKARLDYERFASLETPDEQAAFEIGRCLVQGADFAQASEYFRSSISRGSTAPSETLLLWARTLRELKQMSMAESVLRLGQRMFPETALFALLLGQTLLDQDQYEEARSFLEEALVRLPRNPEVYFAQARMAWALGELEKGIMFARHCLSYDPYHKGSLKLLNEQKKKLAQVIH
ncbi:MAG: fused MFS/spermidine synthase [Candidatus Omnitrophica bacterium]|nr:fused MFS/spermidine synthase [Candidatus Omnitrophota bacterium]